MVDNPADEKKYRRCGSPWHTRTHQSARIIDLPLSPSHYRARVSYALEQQQLVRARWPRVSRLGRLKNIIENIVSYVQRRRGSMNEGTENFVQSGSIAEIIRKIILP